MVEPWTKGNESSIRFMTYVFGGIKIRKKVKSLLWKHGLNKKLKIPRNYSNNSSFSNLRKYFQVLHLHNYIQKMFPTPVLGTAQLQFENILKLKITESFSSSVWKTQVIIRFSLRGSNLLQTLLFNFLWKQLPLTFPCDCFCTSDRPGSFLVAGVEYTS